jgi:hypothetical protein
MAKPCASSAPVATYTRLLPSDERQISGRNNGGLTQIAPIPWPTVRFLEEASSEQACLFE